MAVLNFAYHYARHIVLPNIFQKFTFYDFVKSCAFHVIPNGKDH